MLEKKLQNYTIVLASSSNGRNFLLSLLKIPFKVITSDIDEESINPKDPKELVLKRAQAKGKSVEKKLPKNKNCLIIAADSMAFLNNKPYGKAKDEKEAIRFLSDLSGKTHQFLTGTWIKDTKSKKVWNNISESFVTIRKLSNKEIRRYSRYDNLTKYAGAYSIFNSPQDFVTKIEGSITNVIGLPLEILLPIINPT